MLSRLLNFLRSEQEIILQYLYTIIYKYIFPLFSVAALTLVRISLESSTPASTSLLFSTVVFLHAWLAGFYSGMIAAVASALVTHYFFLAPAYSFKYDQPGFLLGSMLFMLQSLIICYLAGRYASNRARMRETIGKLAFGEQQLRETIDSVFAFVAIISPRGNVLEANRAFAQLLPNLWDNLIGTDFLELTLWENKPETHTRLKNALNSALNGTHSNFDEKILVNGAEKYLELTMVPIFKSKSRQVKYVILSAIDITERKEYEQELERVQENYTKLVNSNVIGMAICNQTGEIHEANDALLTTMGYTRAQFQAEGLNWLTMQGPVSQSTYQEDNAAIESTGAMGPVQRELVRRNGEVVPVIVHAIVIDEDASKILCLLIDMTEQKALDRKKDEFLSIASHELKTPLTTLKGYAQLLHKRMDDRYEENMKYMSVIERQTNKLAELIDDLLDISRIQAGKLTVQAESFNLVDLVKETTRDIQLLSQQHAINFIPSAATAMVQADRFRITQVITNFLTNAIKYSAESDKINVYLKIDEKKRAVVTVEDFGTGIEPGLRNKIFDKFFQVSPESMAHSQSLGLGLYISSEIIHHHGGDIWVDSELGKGAQFSFALPLTQ